MLPLLRESVLKESVPRVGLCVISSNLAIPSIHHLNLVPSWYHPREDLLNLNLGERVSESFRRCQYQTHKLEQVVENVKDKPEFCFKVSENPSSFCANRREIVGKVHCEGFSIWSQYCLEEPL